MGPLIWAAQHGCLEEWLDRGIALVESSGRLGGRLGGYGINSDSLGGSYLECLEAAALPEPLRVLRDDPITGEMRRHRDSFPPLPLVDRYIARIGAALAAMIAARDECGLHLNTAAEALQLRPDGTVAVRTRSGGTAGTLVGRSVVVAVGGRPLFVSQTLAPGLRLGDCRVRQMMPSGDLLTHEGLASADRLMRGAEGRRIVLLGGSHSAYACAWALLALPAAEGLVDGQLAILQRRPPRVFYPDRAAAEADGLLVDAGDVCHRTGRVNRMGGLRGHGRDMWRRIARRPDSAGETRVAIHPLHDYSAAALRAEIEEAALVVPCFGYRSATLPVFDASGEPIRLAADEDGNAVDSACRLLRADGREFTNIFGIGLGTGYRPSANMGCEPNFDGQANSLWLYQNDIGGLIHAGIHAALAPFARAAE